MRVTNYASSKSGVKRSMIAVACENCGHIMVVKTGKSLSSFKSLAAVAKEFISDCPACGEKVTVKEKMSIFGDVSAYKEPGEALEAKLQAAWEEELNKELSDLVDKVKKPEDQPADNPTAMEIRGDISRIKQYLDAVIKLETDKRFLISRIFALGRQRREEQRKAVDAQLDAVSKSRRADTAAANKINELNAEIERLEAKFAGEDWEKLAKVRKVPAPKEPEYLDISIPAEPPYPVLKKPDRNGVYPNEPRYPQLKTPGLFNKKKVQEENEQLLARYEAAVASYRRACERENLQLLARYEKAMEEWRQECAQAEQKKLKNEALRAEYEQKVQKHRAAVAQRKEKAQAEAQALREQARQELEQKIAEIRQEIADVSCGVTAPRIKLQIGQFFDVQIEAAKKQLRAVTAEMNRLYSVNVIYTTYRELVAESSFYEYFNSGRVESLDGTHGAYNLFETECRSDVAARMIRTVEEIKQGQVILFRQLSEIGTLQRELDEALEKALPHVRKVSAEMMPDYVEDNRAKGAAAARKEKTDAKETAVAKYFRLAASGELRVEKSIESAKEIKF